MKRNSLILIIICLLIGSYIFISSTSTKPTSVKKIELYASSRFIQLFEYAYELEDSLHDVNKETKVTKAILALAKSDDSHHALIFLSPILEAEGIEIEFLEARVSMMNSNMNWYISTLAAGEEVPDDLEKALLRDIKDAKEIVSQIDHTWIRNGEYEKIEEATKKLHKLLVQSR
jgi:hypothetical protein